MCKYIFYFAVKLSKLLTVTFTVKDTLLYRFPLTFVHS